jgi:glycosyltransferase involved in cell wall biosynthesis
MITALVLTFDEQKHIARCLQSIAGVCDAVLVVDSYSSDATADIARDFGAEVLQHPFRNYATQMNWGLDQLAGRGGWILRLDADEVVTAATAQKLRRWVESAPPEVDGLFVRRRIHFMGRRMRWGGVDPVWQLRLFRNGRGRCEMRWMDEHIEVPGATLQTDIVVDDINLNSLTWWTEKHNRYASREAIDILLSERRDEGATAAIHGQAQIKRWLKTHLYLRLSPGLRSTLYFLYRYVVRLGVLDGREGFYFHLLQGHWYRTLVDAKVQEIRNQENAEDCSLERAIQAVTGFSVGPAAEEPRPAAQINAREHA